MTDPELRKLVELLAARFGRDRKYQINFQAYYADSVNKNIISRCNDIEIFNFCPNYDPTTNTGGVVITVNNFPIMQNVYWSSPANWGEVDWSNYPLTFTSLGAADPDQVVWVARKTYYDNKDF